MGTLAYETANVGYTGANAKGAIATAETAANFNTIETAIRIACPTAKSVEISFASDPFPLVSSENIFTRAGYTYGYANSKVTISWATVSDDPEDIAHDEMAFTADLAVAAYNATVLKYNAMISNFITQQIAAKNYDPADTNTNWVLKDKFDYSVIPTAMQGAYYTAGTGGADDTGALITAGYIVFADIDNHLWQIKFAQT